MIILQNIQNAYLQSVVKNSDILNINGDGTYSYHCTFTISVLVYCVYTTRLNTKFLNFVCTSMIPKISNATRRLTFIMDAYYILCEVRTEILYTNTR